MQIPCSRIVLPLAAALCLAGRMNAETVNFDKETTGTTPAGWTVLITGTGEPKWTIQKDDSAPSRPLVLKQSAWTPRPSFPLCVKPDVSLKDGFVEVRFKPLGGTNDQAAGLVWRLRDASNYYVVRANALEDNVVLYKVEQGKRKALDIVGRTGGYGVAAEVPGRRWSVLRVEFTGARFRVLLNRAELFTVLDATFSEAGAVGLWTKADSVTLFDDFRYGAK